jgi:drug/metabolite transporter (DMT)-like permease
LNVARELQIWGIIALRFGIGAVLLAPTVPRRGSRLPLAASREGLVSALLWRAPFILLAALGLKLTSAAQAASIVPTLMPVFAGVLAWSVLRQRQGRLRRFGYIAIVASLACLVTAGAAVHRAPNHAGIGALAAAAAMWAVYALSFRRSELMPIQAATLICLWSAVLFLPFYLFLGLGRFEAASGSEIALQAVYQGALMSGFAILTYNRVVFLLGPGAATAIIALLPVVPSVLEIPILGETQSTAECASIAVIVLGVMLALKPVPQRLAQTAPQL